MRIANELGENVLCPKPRIHVPFHGGKLDYFTKVAGNASGIISLRIDSISWSSNFSVPRHDMASTEHEGRIFFVGGFNTYEGTTIPIVEVYDFFYNRYI